MTKLLLDYTKEKNYAIDIENERGDTIEILDEFHELLKKNFGINKIKMEMNKKKKLL